MELSGVLEVKLFFLRRSKQDPDCYRLKESVIHFGHGRLCLQARLKFGDSFLML